jgi:hypothetical protein
MRRRAFIAAHGLSIVAPVTALIRAEQVIQ